MLTRLLLAAFVAAAVAAPAAAATDGTSNTMLTVRSVPAACVSFMDYTDDACLAFAVRR